MSNKRSLANIRPIRGPHLVPRQKVKAFTLE